MAAININEASTPEELKNQIAAVQNTTVQNTAVFHQITIDEYLLAKEEIKFRLENIANDFIAIGFRLRQIKDSEAYRQEGYTSISEFAQKEYSIDESATSRLITINKHFSVGGYSDKLKPEYKNYGTSLLYEMTKMTEEDRKLIVAGTTIASIRELKRFNREAEETKNNNKEANTQLKDKPKDNSTETGTTSCKEEEHNETANNTTEVVTAEILSEMPATYSDLEKVIIEFFRSEKELLTEIYQMSDYESIADRINPSGSRTFRKAIYMLFMYGYGEGLILKKMGEENKNYTWQQFIETTVGIYKAAYTDHDTVWENFYRPEPETEQTENTAIETTGAENTDTENAATESAEAEIIEADITKTKQSAKAEHAPQQTTYTQYVGKEENKGEKAEAPAVSILSVKRWYMADRNMSLDMGVKQEIADRLCIRTTPEVLEKITEFIETVAAGYAAYIYKKMGGRNE